MQPEPNFLLPFFNLINALISIYLWIVIAAVVSSWLVAFNVINTRNRFVYVVMDFLHRATEPVLRPIRRFIPNLGGIDFSPIILFLLIFLAQDLLQQLFISLAYG